MRAKDKAALIPNNWAMHTWTDVELTGAPETLLLAWPEHTDRHRQLRAKGLAALACLVVRRADEAGYGDAHMGARLELSDACIHFEMSSVKELLFLHVEEYVPSFVGASNFSSSHREDTSALDLITEGIKALSQEDAALIKCGQTGVPRHRLTIPFFQLPKVLLKRLVGQLMKSNTILFWPASMHMDCRLPAENKAKLTVDGMYELVVVWEHQVEEMEEYDITRICHELALLGAATNARWPAERMNLLYLGDKCWATNVQKPTSVLQVDSWLAEVAPLVERPS